MEKLIEECKLDCPEEKQIQVLEKCLPFVGTDRDIQSRSMGWLLLARILERRLSIELYSIRYGCDAQMSEVLLNTLSAAMAKRLLSQEERAGVLHLKSFGVSSSRDDLCILLFELYSSSLCFAKAGQFVLRDDIMSVLEAGLNDLQLRESALGTIPQVVTILISKLDAPIEALFDTLTHICRVYGPGSTLFRHFYAICSALRHPLDEQILMSIQRKVSEQVVLNPNSSVYRDLLTSFLSCTHELVPPPVQIARTVISRCSDASYVRTLNYLCDIITRPRMQNLASHEIVCRSLVKLERDADMDTTNGKQRFATTNSSGVEAFEEFENEICNALEGTVRQNSLVEKPSGNQVATSFEEAAVVEKPPTSQEVVASTSTSNGCNMDDEIMIEAVPAVSKRNLEEQIEFVPDFLKSVKEPIVKKTKKSDAQLQKPLEVATLLDGELSVDEILSTFCPD
ncbi:unnamed protein product [Angiostrongylus costaricensis]|uniref:Symplekin_C domain-containing protein n=1 Tax=Angiostrongylus costaricensis TaxID=334426 RepID=A0A158PM75_ANGCS|nr:unnamed protein product [Angiostrongylus costaricensis]